MIPLGIYCFSFFNALAPAFPFSLHSVVTPNSSRSSFCIFFNMSSFTPPVGCTSRNFATVNGFSYIRICIWEWHLQHCNPPRSREEFDRICKWTIDTFREERDKKHEEARSKRNNYADMQGCVSYQINSNADKFVVSTPDNKLVETIHK